MPKLVYRISGLLSSILQDIPIGTNLGLALLMWAIMSGRLVTSQGALFPALAGFGLSNRAVYRSWRALWQGSWAIEEMVDRWQEVVAAEQRWQPHDYEGWRPVAMDLTAFFRPRLAGLKTKHHDNRAGRALPAIPFGVSARVGSVAGQRLGMPLVIERMPEKTTSESKLKVAILRRAEERIAENEVMILDAGFTFKHLRAAGVKRYVVRLRTDFTGRRNEPMPYKGRGRRPEYGEYVRPLPRTRNGKLIESTPPDRTMEFADGDHIIRVALWDNLVARNEKADAADSFSVAVIRDPRYRTPLVVAFSIEATPPAIRQLYLDRWSVELIPQTAKRLLGGERHYVHAQTSRHRLPEVLLLCGAVVSYVAATHDEAIPTGFWDRQPERTPGRLRRALARVDFSTLRGLAPRIRKKRSRTDHLPKGAEAHTPKARLRRREKAA